MRFSDIFRKLAIYSEILQKKKIQFFSKAFFQVLSNNSSSNSNLMHLQNFELLPFFCLKNPKYGQKNWTRSFKIFYYETRRFPE